LGAGGGGGAAATIALAGGSTGFTGSVAGVSGLVASWVNVSSSRDSSGLLNELSTSIDSDLAGRWKKPNPERISSRAYCRALRHHGIIFSTICLLWLNKLQSKTDRWRFFQDGTLSGVVECGC
jgi:hypothetical protein